MNAIQEIKSNVLAFEAKHRVIPKTIAAVSALEMTAITASAETGSGSVDISAVTDSMSTSLADLASKVGIACSGVVGAGLSIFAIKWAVVKVMAFFRAIGK